MPQFGGASEKCSVCSKTVYLAEKIVVEDKEDKKTFHKTCLKCSHCKATLSLGNYASMNGVMYCKPHFKQLFATKGNYDEGFGKEKHTTKWTPNAAPATPGNSFVPVDKVEDAKPAEKKDTPSSIASRFGKSTLNSEKCEKCSKTVYATEKIVIEEKDGKKVYHKACLRCSHCQVVLTLGNYSAMNGVTYCKPHLKQLFATKGNYDEGFGKEKHTTKWEPTANTTPTTFVPVEKVEISKDNKPAAASSEIASKFKNISGSNTCDKCGKTVYLTEKVVVEDKEEKKLFHKACLRCTHCQVVLSLGNYASMDGVTYCKPHFKQLFAAKGNYDEGFGKERHTAKWVEKEDEGESEHHEKAHREETQPRHEQHHEEPRHEEPRHEEPRHEEPRHEEHEEHHEKERRHDSDEDRHEKTHHDSDDEDRREKHDSSSSSSDDEDRRGKHLHGDDHHDHEHREEEEAPADD